MPDTFYALVFYPGIDHPGISGFREKYDPWAKLLPLHVPFIFPVPENIRINALERHIMAVLSEFTPFDVRLTGLTLSWDMWLMLKMKEGNARVVELHDRLYTGILKPYLRDDIPFLPHMALGLFCRESYDPGNPGAGLTLDEGKYNKALKECELKSFDYRDKVNNLTLIQLSADYSWCKSLRELPVGKNSS